MVKSRREKEKDSRRELILDAAEKVFLERGYDSATMDEIAAAAEFTKKSVYSYFPTKDELFAAAILRASEVLFRIFNEVSVNNNTGIEKISAIGDAYVQFYREYNSCFRILSMRRSGGVEQPGEYRVKIEKYWSKVFSLMADSFVQGSKDGTLRKDIDPVTAALYVMSSSNGVLDFVASCGDSLEKIYKVNADEFIKSSMNLIGDAIISDKVKKGGKK
ncbi:MAG: TetR/AcrR family transcriptional regulator [Spirochaetes bacterium]|nr:TetR/AcrR family transcriptional regulator [Spirochaetota bacterium]